MSYAPLSYPSNTEWRKNLDKSGWKATKLGSQDYWLYHAHFSQVLASIMFAPRALPAIVYSTGTAQEHGNIDRACTRKWSRDRKGTIGRTSDPKPRGPTETIGYLSDKIEFGWTLGTVAENAFLRCLTKTRPQPRLWWCVSRRFVWWSAESDRCRHLPNGRKNMRQNGKKVAVESLSK